MAPSTTRRRPPGHRRGRAPKCAPWCSSPRRADRMPDTTYRTALIVGAGRGLSASLARLFAREGLAVALAARDTDKLAPLCQETGARAFSCDATDPGQVKAL